MKYFLSTILLLFASSLFAAEAIGPTTCVVGELVVLDASSLASEEVIWKVLRVDSSLIESQDFKAFGKVACFSARESGLWLVIVSGVAEGKPCMLIHSIEVGGGSVAPKLETQMKQWVPLVKSKNVKEEASRLAQSFQIIASTDLPVEKMLEATAIANKQALGNSLQAWIPFLDKLGDHLDQLAADKKLVTKEDYKKVWLDIASAIERNFK
jgi:hypothetical protein